MIHADLILATALSQVGDRYVWGAETRPSDPNPTAEDCSELVEWACKRTALMAGVPGDLVAQMPDGSSNQMRWCLIHRTEVAVARAIGTRGALLWHPGHIAFSMGDGRTMEAKGRAWGVGHWSAYGRFSRGALIPGAAYGIVAPAPKPGQKKRRPKMIIVRAKGHDPVYAWNGLFAAHMDSRSIDLLVAAGVAVRNGNAPFELPYDSLNRAHVVGARNDKTMPGDGK